MVFLHLFFFEFGDNQLSELEKEIKSVMHIYEKLGQKITGITFEIVE